MTGLVIRRARVAFSLVTQKSDYPLGSTKSVR